MDNQINYEKYLQFCVYPDIENFKEELKWLHKCGTKIVTTSGGFDPLHVGHLRCLQESKYIADDNAAVLIVIVNGDGFLTRKKGKPFMSHLERMEIVSGIRGVDYVVGWDDGSQTVTGALEIIKPFIFTKGGDRSLAQNVPEFEVCQNMGTRVMFGVGGTNKAQSSSDLIKNSKE